MNGKVVNSKYDKNTFLRVIDLNGRIKESMKLIRKTEMQEHVFFQRQKTLADVICT